MLAQALAAFADRELSDQLENEAWEEKPVPFLISIDNSGRFLGVIPRMKEALRGKKTQSVPATLPVPRSPVPRNAGLYPLLAADDIKYVLGVGPWTKEKEKQNHQDRHEAFVRLILDSANATGDAGLQAAAAFYARPDQVAAARTALAETKPGTIVALALVSKPILSSPKVLQHWSSLYSSASSTRVAGSGSGECLISGKFGPIAPTHEKIKGLASLGGQPAGVSLMSFDKDAFCSYGWEQNANSPVAPDRAMAYVLALNHLLRQGGPHRYDIGNIGFIFWTKDTTDFNPFTVLNPADPTQVQQLLRLNPNADPEPNMFYMAGVAGNGGRMLVRYWVAETLEKVKANVEQWRSELRIANVFTGQVSDTPSLWQLLYALHRDGKPPADFVLTLFRRPVEGRPLGLRILAAALSRLHLSKGKDRISPARAGLIRLCLNDNIKTHNKGETLMTAALDLGQKHPAYLCGRLMAVYESLQYSASGEVNQTVADRYFTLASTYPAQAFPKLEDLGNKHLRKLRRDNHGAMVNIEKEIDQLHLEIEQSCGFKFPAALDLDAQGRFALGYHHQRAHQMTQAQARKKAKQDQPDSEDKTQEN